MIIIDYFILSYFIGWIYDATGSYDTAFCIAGTITAGSGLMLFFVPCLKYLETGKSSQEKINVDSAHRITTKTEDILVNGGV